MLVQLHSLPLFLLPLQPVPTALICCFVVGEIMDNRAEKWIGNVRGWSNQNVWGAASPFEAIRVDGSQ